jgi:hypothetical protein
LRLSESAVAVEATSWMPEVIVVGWLLIIVVIRVCLMKSSLPIHYIRVSMT